MERTYAIGDVHGHLDQLTRAHARISADRARTGDDGASVVHLGDLVDRGPESAEVVEYLLMGQAAGAPWITLKGNHDHMFALFLGDATAHDPGLRLDLTWLDPRLGGLDTLASYGVGIDAGAGAGRDLADLWREAKARVPAAHRAFLAALPLCHRTRAAFLVHAGVRPGVPLDAQAPGDMMWIRQPFLDDPRDHGALVVHGHTVIDGPRHYGNRVNLDTGAGYGRGLTAAVIEGRDVWVLGDEGRIPLHPDAAIG